MGTWDRKTKWRQGVVVPTGLAYRLGLVPDESERHVVVVVTHDCDLLNSPDVEPYVEVVCGRRIDRLDGQCTFGKSARTLHLEYEKSDGSLQAVELYAPRKARVLKVDAAGLSLSDGEPDDGFRLPVRTRNHLRAWLASRYNRHALPDEFERRMKETGVADGMLKAFKATGASILALYVELDDGHQREHDGEDDPFEVSLYLVYDTSHNPDEAQKAAEKTKTRIEECFTKRCHGGDPKSPAKWLSLTAVEVFSASTVTLDFSQQFTRWRLDYLSFRDDPEQPVLAD